MIKKFVSGGALGLVRLLAGVVRVKFTATMLGVAGVGLIAQANQFHLLSIALMTLSMAVGLINLTRDAKTMDNKDLRAKTQGTALTTILALSLLYLCIVYGFSEEILRLVFDQNMPIHYLYLLLLGLPFTAIASGYIEGLFFSRDRYDLYVKGSALASILELCSFILLIHSLGLKGAFIAIAVSGPILLLSFAFYLRQIGEPFYDLFALQFQWREFIKIMRYCAVVISSSALGYFVTLWARADIIRALGPEANGLIQPAIALSAYAMPFITNGVWGHLHPKASLSGDTAQGRNELQPTLKLATSVSAICSLTFITFSQVLIPLIYSGSFISGADSFPAQFVGDFFYYIFFTVNVYFIATSQLKRYLLNWCFYYGGLLALVKLLISHFGILAYSLSHLIISIILCGACSIWLIQHKVLRQGFVKHYLVLFCAVALSGGLAIYRVGYFATVPLWILGLYYIYHSRETA